MIVPASIPSVGLCVVRSVGRSVRNHYPGKTVEWIQMPFGMVGGMGPGIGVLNFDGNRRREGAVLGVPSRDLDSKTADYRLHCRLGLKSIRVLEKKSAVCT